MFEQSLVSDYSGAQKNSSLAVSLLAQIAGAGVLLIVPLVYHQILPAVRLSTPLAVPLTPPPPVAEVQPGPVSNPRPVLTINSAHPFLVPTRVPEGRPVVFETLEPAVAGPGSFVNPASPFTQISAAPAITIAPPPPPPPAPAAKSEPKQVQLTSALLAARLIRKVVPAYPALARQARVQGTVHLLGVVAKDGTVQQLRVLSGHPLLVQAALEAVRQWVYSPTLLNGQPVEVSAPIDVIFTLQ